MAATPFWSRGLAQAQETNWEIAPDGIHDGEAELDPWLIAMQGMIEQKSKTFPFSIATSVALSPGPLTHRSEDYFVRTGLGLRLRSPTDGLPDNIARRLVLVGPLSMIELGSRARVAVADELGLHVHGGLRFGVDATRLDSDNDAGLGARTVRAAVIGTQVGTGLSVSVVQLGVGLESYRVLTESALATYRSETHGRVFPSATLIVRLSSVHLFARALLGGGQLLRSDSWSAGVGGSLYP